MDETAIAAARDQIKKDIYVERSGVEIREAVSKLAGFDMAVAIMRKENEQLERLCSEMALKVADRDAEIARLKSEHNDYIAAEQQRTEATIGNLEGLLAASNAEVAKLEAELVEAGKATQVTLSHIWVVGARYLRHYWTIAMAWLDRASSDSGPTP
jgi:predicted RNase H-like nuclease (RuvC/YqgF family)